MFLSVSRASLAPSFFSFVSFVGSFVAFFSTSCVPFLYAHRFATRADVSDDDEEEDAWEPRSRLPAPRPLGKGFSIWTVLKDAIGGDLTRITMPATINEPSSFLQVSIIYICVVPYTPFW